PVGRGCPDDVVVAVIDRGRGGDELTVGLILRAHVRARPAEHVVGLRGGVLQRVGDRADVATRVVGHGGGVVQRVGDGLRVAVRVVVRVAGLVAVWVGGCQQFPGRVVSVGGGEAGRGAGRVAVGVGDGGQVAVGVVREGPQPLLGGELGDQVRD